MNYRHVFHAGNFADVLKHAMLARIMSYQQAKPGALAVLDSHAGAGLYDLAGSDAQRTGEASGGILRLDDAPLSAAAEKVLAPYRKALALVRAQHGATFYPGSPLIAAHLLRAHDRYEGAELHPDAAQQLRRLMMPGALVNTSRVRVAEADGYAQLRRRLPPPERRGLVLIDPPFERRDEFDRMQMALRDGLRHWATGTYMAWYPIKNPKESDVFVTETVSASSTDWLRLELHVRPLDSPDGLAGCGLLILNPPWTLPDEAECLLPELAQRLALGDRAGYRCEGTVR